MPLQFAKRMGRPRAVHLWHLPIKQDDVDVSPAKNADCLLAAIGGQWAMAQKRDKAGDELADEAGVECGED